MRMQEIFDHLNTLAPVSTAMEYDNPGFLVGDPNRTVTGILVALDCTPEVIAEAVTRGANLIVTHHPVIFNPLLKIVAGSLDGDRIRALLGGGISVISMHTNLDRAAGGVNDCLADRLSLRNVRLLPDGEGIGRVGELPAPLGTDSFLTHVKASLDVETVRTTRVEKRVARVAVGGGSCADYLNAAAAAGCDALVTAECKHKQFIEAAHLGLLLVDATHYGTENVVVRPLAEYIRKLCPQVNVAETLNPVRFF
ncbi:MAG: Nif3-like dinuclear metal center hexameric protein [Clostridiaceae bacterium]|nr:Nif3-like dinuclear metal center hexameric protein [Clostridiaceae bacterium]